jgi:hypothetical protein
LGVAVVLIAALVSMMIVDAAMAAGDPVVGHPLTFGDESRSAELTIDHGKVDLHMRRDTDDNPPAVVLTLFDQNDSTTTLELKNLSPSNPEGDGISNYSGTLLGGHAPGEASTSPSPAQQSFVGVEIRIPLSQDAPEVLGLRPLD